MAAKNKLPTRFPKVTTRKIVSHYITFAREEHIPMIQLTGTPHHGIALLTAAIGKIYNNSGLMTHGP